MSSPRLEVLSEAPRGAARRAPPLLFVHGAFCDAHCWRPLMARLAEAGYACHALSLEGHGASDGRAYLPLIGIADYVKNLATVARALPEPPVLVGHSMGGFVVQQYLARHPAAAAALLAPVPPTGLAASSWRLMTRAPALFLTLNLFQHGHHQPALDELRAMLFCAHASDDAVAELARHAQPESQRALFDMALVSPFLLPRLPAMPALVLGAAHDALIAADEVAACARRLDCRADILPDLGHMMMLDAGWERVVERLARWLDATFPLERGAAAA
ncbi:alpha-beta hydrolase superfamily lysophospholipase [Crenobacter luteus]|uniref:alpha/beta hydrolase n=1 Tax=Crenobacter luteus TaxID=1452487 RepID=UPI0010443A14|nr:alpha/beta fold hydrolase [Crenobacter luteus]TCP11612.1 alpha-beta hydrolase superfamily lysophospholipase [Crenobacter luteus]